MTDVRENAGVALWGGSAAPELERRFARRAALIERGAMVPACEGKQGAAFRSRGHARNALPLDLHCWSSLWPSPLLSSLPPKRGGEGASFRWALSVTRDAQHVAAPEVQQKKVGSFSSDMFSLGMTICAIYNQGRPLIQANHSCSDYLKQLETVSWSNPRARAARQETSSNGDHP